MQVMNHFSIAQISIINIPYLATSYINIHYKMQIHAQFTLIRFIILLVTVSLPSAMPPYFIVSLDLHIDDIMTFSK